MGPPWPQAEANEKADFSPGGESALFLHDLFMPLFQQIKIGGPTAILSFPPIPIYIALPLQAQIGGDPRDGRPALPLAVHPVLEIHIHRLSPVGETVI